jgi:hypothetical protein
MIVLIASSTEDGGLLVNTTKVLTSHASGSRIVDDHLDSFAGGCRSVFIAIGIDIVAYTANSSRLGCLLPSPLGTSRTALLTASSKMFLQIESCGKDGMDLFRLFSDSSATPIPIAVGGTDALHALPVTHGQITELGEVTVGMESKGTRIAAEKNSILLAYKATLREDDWRRIITGC